MKKMIAIVLTLAMVAALCVGASAASITSVVEFDAEASVIFTEVAEEKIVTIEDIVADVQTILESDAEEIQEVKAILEEQGIVLAELKIVDEQNVEGEISEENAATTVITVNGVADGTPVVVFFKAAAEGAAWEVLAVGTAPEVEVNIVAEGMIVVAIA